MVNRFRNNSSLLASRRHGCKRRFECVRCELGQWNRHCYCCAHIRLLYLHNDDNNNNNIFRYSVQSSSVSLQRIQSEEISLIWSNSRVIRMNWCWVKSPFWLAGESLANRWNTTFFRQHFMDSDCDIHEIASFPQWISAWNNYRICCSEEGNHECALESRWKDW